MKHARKALIFLILLVTPLLLAGVLPPAINDEIEATISPITTKVSVPSYEDLTPILAYNDFDMDNYASALEWDGDGSPGDPYIIEGYNITSNSDSILIHDTSRAFEIRNCLITSYTGTSGNGIMINNATQVAIVDTIVMDKSDTIDVRNVPSLNIENCTIYDGGSNVFIFNCTGATITDCVIYNNFGGGIYLDRCNFSMISNNVVNGTAAGAGINLYLSHNVTIIGNYIFDCLAMGIWAAGSHNATIIGNEIFDNSQNGIYVFTCEWIYIFDNEIYGNSDHGIDAVYSVNGTVLQNDIHENGWWPVFTNSLCGIFLGQEIRDWVISENQIWNNTPAGISLNYASDVEISNNDIFLNEEYGIHGLGVGGSSLIKILDNQIHGNGLSLGTGGIILYGYENCTIDENIIYNNTGSGILIHGPDNNITKNVVYDTVGNGINIEMTSYNLVLENIVYDNTKAGIFLYAGNTDVIGNIVYDNGVGIHLYSSTWCNVYMNDIGWNDINALQEYGLPNNLWNYVFEDIGNHWSDYYPRVGEGIDRYPITNGTHTVAYDLYPDMSINLTSATPTSYEILETGNVLVWDAYAKNPSSYAVFIDGEYAYSETWDGGPVELNVDGLPHGFHEVMLSVFHISNHGRGYLSNVTVEDLTSPSDIEGPSVIEIAVGDEVSTQFSSEDSSGLEWAVNDTINFAISSTGLLTNLVDLPAGNYIVRITVSDPYGHDTTLDVTIVVSAPAGLPTELILAIGAGGAIVILIVGAIVYKRKRG